MKYAHLADLHLGCWRDQKMQDLSVKAFLTAMDNCAQEKVDFILFAGDLFNTSLPALDVLKTVTKKLKEIKDIGIPIYAIAGSHDFSPSGKTMIDVLENAGLLKNVCRGTIDQQTKQLQLNFTIDPATGAKITGILGRKGLLDKTYYQNLHLDNLEQETGYKIFLFHTALSELMPSHLAKLESQAASFLPKNFSYYAGGHIHHPSKIELPEYGPLTYPGALFPGNFAEVEKYSIGGYYLITFSEDKSPTDKSSEDKLLPYQSQEIKWVPLEIIKHKSIPLDCTHLSAEVITYEILQKFADQELNDTIITIRLYGKLENGKVSDINFKGIFERLYSQGAYFIMKNTTQLSSEEFEEIKINPSAPELVEEEIIKEHLQQIKLFDPATELSLTKSLLSSLNTTKKEGENNTDFQKRVEEELNKLLNV